MILALKRIYNQIIKIISSTDRNLLHIIWTLFCLGMFLFIMIQLHQGETLPTEVEISWALISTIVVFVVWLVVTGLIGDPD